MACFEQDETDLAIFVLFVAHHELSEIFWRHAVG